MMSLVIAIALGGVIYFCIQDAKEEKAMEERERMNEDVFSTTNESTVSIDGDSTFLRKDTGADSR